MNEYSIFTKIDMTTNNIELGNASVVLDDLRTHFRSLYKSMTTIHLGFHIHQEFSVSL